jgi:magnesium transporter
MIEHAFGRERGSPLRAVADRDWLDPERFEFLWVDVLRPTEADIRSLYETFRLHELVRDDLLREVRHRPQLEELPGYFFGVLYAARFDQEEHAARGSELRFVWGQNYLITVHMDNIPEIDHLAARARSNLLTSVVAPHVSDVAVSDLVYRLIDALVDGYFPVIDELAEWIDTVQSRMFHENRTPEMVEAILNVRTNLIQIRRVMAPSREVVNVLLRREHELFTEELDQYFQDIYEHTVRITDIADTYRDVLSSTLATYTSLVSNDLNRTVRKMTAITVTLMTAALVVGFYGQNFDFMPLLHVTWGAVWSLGLMGATSALSLVIFRWIGWW